MTRLTLFLCGLLCALAACGDDDPPPNNPPPSDGGIDSPGATSGPCLDRPTDLPRPSTTLPCELLPPGYTPPE